MVDGENKTPRQLDMVIRYKLKYFDINTSLSEKLNLSDFLFTHYPWYDEEGVNLIMRYDVVMGRVDMMIEKLTAMSLSAKESNTESFAEHNVKVLSELRGIIIEETKKSYPSFEV